MDFDFIAPGEKAALIAITQPDILQCVQNVLTDSNFKYHSVDTSDEFATRFGQFEYLPVIIHETFASNSLEENETLKIAQRFSMPVLRHAVFFLIGERFETMNTLQAFQQSMHAVINPTELPNMKAILDKTLTESDLFMHTYRDVFTLNSKGDL